MSNNNITTKIRELNDQLRITGRGGRIMLTRGVQELGEKKINNIITEVRLFNNFTNDNNPYSEHDFAKVIVDNISVFFKIDYYDKSLQFGSPNPADQSITERVMTIMLTEEY